MLDSVLYLAHMSLPLWAIGFLVLFVFSSKRRLLFSFLFGVFSFFTYLTHVMPYLVVEKELLIAFNHKKGDSPEFKLAVLNDYTSSYLRNEEYLTFLWSELKGRGFQGMVVRERQFSLLGDSLPKENLRIFTSQARAKADFRIAFTYPELMHFFESEEDLPIIWMDWEGEGASFLKALPVPPDGQEMLYLSFDDHTRSEWFSFLSKVDMTVVRF